MQRLVIFVFEKHAHMLFDYLALLIQKCVYVSNQRVLNANLIIG